MTNAFYEKKVKEIAQLNELNNFAGKTILLSGATGMIGKCLIDVIMQYNVKHEMPIKVTVLSRNETSARNRLQECFGKSWFTFCECDVNQPIPECGNADYIIHAASNTHPAQYAGDPIGTITSNIFGTKNLLDYAVKHSCERFLFVSSVEVYGENRGDVEAYDESYLGYLDCNTLRAGYPESKRLGESLCNAYHQTYGLDFVIPRLSRCYGPTMLLSDSKAVAQFLKSAAAGRNIILKSEGTQQYSYSFVTDAVSGILTILEKGVTGNAYNVADSQSTVMLKELAGRIAAFAGTEVVFELPDKNEERGYSAHTRDIMNADKLEKLGWHARVHLTEGIECTVNELKER